MRRLLKIVWLVYVVIALVLLPINSYNYWHQRDSFWRWLVVDNLNAAANSAFWPVALPHQLGWL